MMARLWWLPYTVFALLGAPAISIAVSVVVAFADSDLGFVYFAATLGIPVALVVGVLVERRSRAAVVGLLAVAALAMCLAAQLSLWSGIR
jgi:hypothetical protein